MVLRYLRACAVGVELHCSSALCYPLLTTSNEGRGEEKEREEKMQEQQYKITNKEVKKKRDD